MFLLFLQGKFAEAPIVLVTSEHLRTGKEYDAALIWIEDVTKDSVKVCLREMQNFDGRHQDITVVTFLLIFLETGTQLSTKFLRNAGL